MKGIILAGGLGTRLNPLTESTNKHLLQVGQYPMILYSIYKLYRADIRDVLIITNKRHIPNFYKLLGDGSSYDMQIKYQVQRKPNGIGDALKLARQFVGNKKMIVILGDNIFEDSLNGYVADFMRQDCGAKVLLKSVQDPERYGVAFIKKGQIQNIEEKPKNPKTNLVVTGIYMYHNDVFEKLDRINTSNRGELEITDVNNEYIKSSILTYEELKGWWIDAGTFPSLSMANQLASDIRLEFENSYL